jgi:peroxiredoxin 2/4
VKKLSDYKGKWLVLFSHPADFTPVCTTEFTAFAKAYPEFQKLNCELLGLSIDSYYSHVAWVRNIKEKFGVEIPFPIIEDLSMKVAKAYGMIHPGAADTSAVRATFIIDDKGILRAMVYYPMTNGRSIPEFVRLVTALQTSDKNKVATPEGWQDKVIVHRGTRSSSRRRYCRGCREAHERRLRVHRLVLLQEGTVNHPLPGDLPQAFGHSGMVRHPPHRLRHGDLYQRHHGRPAGKQSGDGHSGCQWLARHGQGTRLAGGTLHQLADHLRQCEKRGGRCRAHQGTSSGARLHPCLRLHLRL